MADTSTSTLTNSALTLGSKDIRKWLLENTIVKGASGTVSPSYNTTYVNPTGLTLGSDSVVTGTEVTILNTNSADLTITAGSSYTIKQNMPLRFMYTGSTWICSSIAVWA